MTEGGPARATLVLHAMRLYENALLFPAHGVRLRHGVDPVSGHARRSPCWPHGSRQPRSTTRGMNGRRGLTVFSSTFRRHPWSRGSFTACSIAGSLVFVFPALWMLSTSLKPIEETMTSAAGVDPEHESMGELRRRPIAYIPFLALHDQHRHRLQLGHASARRFRARSSPSASRASSGREETCSSA